MPRLAVCLVWMLGCGGETPSEERESDAAVEDGGSVEVETPVLYAFPDRYDGPPGAFADTLLRMNGLGSSVWSLSAEGAPEGVSLSFERNTLDAEHPGTRLRIDLARDASWTGFITLRAESAGRSLEVLLGLGIGEQTDVEQDFMVQVRQAVEVTKTGALAVRETSDATDFPSVPIRVVSSNGFEGDIDLVHGFAEDFVITPERVHVAPGKPADATLQRKRWGRLEGSLTGVAGVHGRTLRYGADRVQATVERDESLPFLSIKAKSKLWLARGESKQTYVSLSPWMISGESKVSATAPSGLSAVLAPSGTLSTWQLELTAASDAAAGRHLLELSARNGAHEVHATTRVVVPKLPDALLSAGGKILASPLPERPGNVVAAPAELQIVADASGLEVLRLEKDGWVRAESKTDFVPSAASSNDASWTYNGILGGRVTAYLNAQGLSLTETRSDVGTQSFGPIAGAIGRPAVAYDAANELWVAGQSAVGFGSLDGLVTVWRRAPSGAVTAHSEGLPTTVIRGGPWLACGIGEPTLAYVHEDRLRVARYAGPSPSEMKWTALPEPWSVALQSGHNVIGLEHDGLGRPVIALIDDAVGISVRRFEAGEWHTLGQVPVTPGRLVMGAALKIDRFDHPLLLWTEAKHALVQFIRPEPGLDVAGVRLASFDGAAWTPSARLELDSAALPGPAALVLASDGTTYLAWTEDGEVVLLQAAL